MTRKMVSTRCNVKAVDHENIFYSHVRNKFVFPYKEQCICISIQRTKKKKEMVRTIWLYDSRKNVQHMDSDQNLT